MEDEEKIKLLAENTELSESDIRDKVTEALEEFDGLVDESGAVMLVANNIDEVDTCDLFNLDPEAKILDVDIEDIEPTKTYSMRKPVEDVETIDPSTKDWAMQKIQLSDDTGSITLVLWNEERRDDIKPGAVLKLKDVYAKDTDYGLQLSTGYKGEIIVEEEA